MDGQATHKELAKTINKTTGLNTKKAVLPHKGTPLPWLNLYRDSRMLDITVKVRASICR